MDLRSRRELARYGAPAAFLAAATIAVLLIKAGLGGSGGSNAPAPTVGGLPSVPATTTAPTTQITLTSPTPASTGSTTTAAGEYYTVAGGDTLGGIATKYDTTVDELVRLNPGIDPTALHIGQKIRVS